MFNLPKNLVQQERWRAWNICSKKYANFPELQNGLTQNSKFRYHVIVQKKNNNFMVHS